MRIEIVFAEEGERNVLTERLGEVYDWKPKYQISLSLSSRALRSILASTHHNEMQAKHAPFLRLVCCPGLDCIWPLRRPPLCCLHRLGLDTLSQHNYV